MDVSEGIGEAEEKRRRVNFWFLCSALGGVAAREMMPNSPEQIAEETFRIAELMTERWVEKYGDKSAE